MRVIVPFAAESPKTRLSDVIEPAERSAFATRMLADVLAAVRGAGHDPEVLATAPVDVDAPVTVDDRPLTPAVNAVLRAGVPVGVVMADLPLATPAAIDRLIGAPGDVVLAPGRAGGTNALVARHPDFRVDYHGASFLDHLAGARDVGASVAVIDSHRLATDIDEGRDLVEVLIHTDGQAAAWLSEAGFDLAVEEGRVDVSR